MTIDEANRLAHEKGTSRLLYAIVRSLVVPFMRIYFRMHIAGAEHVPAEGPAIVAPNHKSFYDAFFLAACTRRHVRFKAKSELIGAHRYRGALLRPLPEAAPGPGRVRGADPGRAARADTGGRR